MATDRSKKKLSLATPARAAARAPKSRRLELREGRSLVVSERGRAELVEVRGSSGEIELRIELTAQGPVLRMEGVRLALKATESVEIDAPRVQVTAEQSLALASQGEVGIAAKADLRIDAEGEIRVQGKMIYLN